MAVSDLLKQLTATSIILGVAVILILGQLITDWVAKTLYPSFPTFKVGVGLQYLSYLTAAVIFFWAVGNLAPGYQKQGIMGILTIGIIMSLFTAFLGWFVFPQVFPQFFTAFPMNVDFNLPPFSVVPLGP